MSQHQALRKRTTTLVVLTAVTAATFSLTLQVAKAKGDRFAPFKSDRTVTSQFLVNGPLVTANRQTSHQTPHETPHQTPLPEPEPEPVNGLEESTNSEDTTVWKDGEAKEYGNASSDGTTVTLASTGTQSASVYQDLNTDEITGKYVVTIAVADTTVTTFTGKPYLYGYLMSGNSIKSYLQGSTMMYDATSGADVVYGIYQVPTGVDGIRLFWKQALRYKEQYNGSVVTFADSAVYVTDTEAEALEIVADYEAQLKQPVSPLVKK